MEYLLKKINSPRGYLLLSNIFLVFFLILLSNLKVLPIRNTGDFIFLTFMFLAFALYRPGWAFLFFTGTIMLENINLAPENLGIAVRPYQFFAALSIIAVLVRLGVKRLNFKLPKFFQVDAIVIFFVLAGFLSALFSADRGASFKLSIIAASFAAIYFLVRIFIQNTDDLKKIIPFFLSSSVIVVLYGIWQNVRFSHNLSSFEAMPGRPNATFTEPDWLGIFIIFLIAVLYSLIYYSSKNTASSNDAQIFNFKFLIFKQFLITKFQILNLFLYILLTASYILLILTISRSAWLGAIAVTIFFLLIIFTNLKFNPREWQWKNTFKIKMRILLSLIIGIAIVYFFNLTIFQLFNRAQSAGSGLQEITISCHPEPSSKNFLEPGSRIDSINELNQYGCRHINLEEIDAEKSRGNFVTEVYRKDPNVFARGQIYQKSWQQIKAHPVLGIGWGSIGEILGRDSRGTALNSSNIFLEIWLGAGVLGLASFLFFWSYIVLMSVKTFLKNQEVFAGYSLFMLVAWMALLVPNLFNAGIFLGLVWIFSGISISLLNYKEE